MLEINFSIALGLCSIVALLILFFLGVLCTNGITFSLKEERFRYEENYYLMKHWIVTFGLTQPLIGTGPNVWRNFQKFHVRVRLISVLLVFGVLVWKWLLH